MRILNSLIVPINQERGPFGIFNIHSAAKDQKNLRRTIVQFPGPNGTFKLKKRKVFKICSGPFFKKNSLKSVEIPKSFVLRRMG